MQMGPLHRLFLFAQDLYVRANSFLSPSMLHNFEKHDALKRALFYTEIEGVKGDYLEFGVYEGTSLLGAVSYWKKLRSPYKRRFYGFDSFRGMRPAKGDEHPFYTTFDFSTDYRIIRKRFASFPEVSLVPGFFSETLRPSAKAYGIKRAGIVMVDCDLYSAAKEVFSFVAPVTQQGTIFVLDDYYNYRGDPKKGVRAAFEEFLKKEHVSVEQMSTYGIGGVIFLVREVASK